MVIITREVRFFQSKLALYCSYYRHYKALSRKSPLYIVLTRHFDPNR